MEINSGHSNVQIAIAVQPQNQSSRTPEMEYGYDSGASSTAAQVESRPSINTSGQEVGNLINTWA